MKKSLLLLILFFFSCKSDDKCGEIFDKISTSDQYIFVVCFEGCNRITTSDFQGSMQSDVKVEMQQPLISLTKVTTIVWSKA